MLIDKAQDAELVGVCYRSPNHAREQDDKFLTHLSIKCRGKMT